MWFCEHAEFCRFFRDKKTEPSETRMDRALLNLESGNKKISFAFERTDKLINTKVVPTANNEKRKQNENNLHIQHQNRRKRKAGLYSW